MMRMEIAFKRRNTTQTKTFRATLMRSPRANPALSPPLPPFHPSKIKVFQAPSTLIKPLHFFRLVSSQLCISLSLDSQMTQTIIA